MLRNDDLWRSALSHIQLLGLGTLAVCVCGELLLFVENVDIIIIIVVRKESRSGLCF